MIMKFLLLITVFTSLIFMQCEYEIGDINNDNLLDVIDVVEFVNFILSENNQEFIANYDLNNDEIVNIIDIIDLVNRILYYTPTTSTFNNIEYDFNNLTLDWTQSEDDRFDSYNVYYSNILSDNQILIYSTSNIFNTNIVIENFSLNEQNWFSIGVEDFMGCELLSENRLYELPYKNYDIDLDGNVINHNFEINDFNHPQDCQGCHPNHYQEWSESMHAYTAHSPIFFSYKNETLINHPNVGDNFCNQCHNPISFLTNTDLSEFETVEEFQNSNLDEVIKTGVSCDVCHTATGISETVHTPTSGAASALFKLFPGENIKFGSIQNPEPNSFHESFYLPTYELSEQCLPCHDLVVRDVEAEITFTEWNRIPGFSMFGGTPCQECHMPVKEDGTHDHHFIGVDMDLAIPNESNPLFNKVSNMLANSIDLSFGIWGENLPESVSPSEIINIPVTVESITAHSIPSGTSFNREAWLELTVTNNNNLVFSSGLLLNNFDNLDYQNPELLLFKSFLLSEAGDTTHSVIDVHDIINNSLPAYSQRFKTYQVSLPDDIEGELNIKARMLFRPFEPDFIINHHEEFLNNIPIFVMDVINTNIPIN